MEECCAYIQWVFVMISFDNSILFTITWAESHTEGLSSSYRPINIYLSLSLIKLTEVAWTRKGFLVCISRAIKHRK